MCVEDFDDGNAKRILITIITRETGMVYKGNEEGEKVLTLELAVELIE